MKRSSPIQDAEPQHLEPDGFSIADKRSWSKSTSCQIDVLGDFFGPNLYNFLPLIQAQLQNFAISDVSSYKS